MKSKLMAPITNENTYANTEETETYLHSPQTPNNSIKNNGLCEPNASINSVTACPTGFNKFKSFPIINGLVGTVNRTRHPAFGFSDDNQTKSSPKIFSQIISEPCPVSC